ncbi:MAG: hypothetical protein R2867_45845 [Caldilineaceae bacterium]
MLVTFCPDPGHDVAHQLLARNAQCGAYRWVRLSLINGYLNESISGIRYPELYARGTQLSPL